MTPLTTVDVAELLGTTREKVASMIREGHLKSYRLPGGTDVRPRRYVSPTDLLDFIVANELPQALASRVAKLTKE